MRKSLKIYLIVIAAIVLIALLVTVGFACASHMSEKRDSLRMKISIAYYTPVFSTESVWMSDDKTFCIVTQAKSSGGKNTLAFVKSSSGEWEKCGIYEVDSKEDNIFVIFKTDALGHTWRVACLAVKEVSESALTMTLSPSVAYPAKERFGLSLENELHMTCYGIDDIELPFIQEEVAS